MSSNTSVRGGLAGEAPTALSFKHLRTQEELGPTSDASARTTCSFQPRFHVFLLEAVPGPDVVFEEDAAAGGCV